MRTMIIDKIVITDFGVYGGVNEFDFSTSSENTVVLCGGTNGAGKTTLFESVMLCFYGKDYDDVGSGKYITKNLAFISQKFKNQLCMFCIINLNGISDCI